MCRRDPACRTIIGREKGILGRLCLIRQCLDLSVRSLGRRRRISWADLELSLFSGRQGPHVTVATRATRRVYCGPQPIAVVAYPRSYGMLSKLCLLPGTYLDTDAPSPTTKRISTSFARCQPRSLQYTYTGPQAHQDFQQRTTNMVHDLPPSAALALAT